QARDSEGVIDTVLRLIEGQSEPAPLTPELAAILDDAAEATARMVAAIHGQAREGEAPDQTVERSVRERGAAGSALVELRADLASTKRDLALMIGCTRAISGGLDIESAREVADEIESRGAPGWFERALSDETA